MGPRQLEPVRVALPAGGFLQGGLSYRDEPADWAVVYVHGFGSVRDGEKGQALEAACARRGYTFAAFDFRGHGESSSTLRELRCAGMLEDLEAVRACLADRGITRLCLVGSSMGGWASAWFALRHPDVVPACVLIAPAFDFPRTLWDRLTEEQRRSWQQTGRLQVRNEWLDTEVGYCLAEDRDRYPAEQLAAGLRTPLLIFHGMRDDTIPYRRTLPLVESAAFGQIELRLFKDGDHRLLALKDEMAEAACDFFARRLPQAGRSAASR
jgi:abhydrolase domain-containing protein 10